MQVEEAVNGDKLKMRQDVVVTRVYFFLCEREIPSMKMEMG